MTSSSSVNFAELGSASRAQAGARFVSERDVAAAVEPLAAASLLFVRFAPMGPNCRGRLREAIDAAIDAELTRRRAPPSGLRGLGDLDETLSDQLYRARAIGAAAIVLFLERLDGSTSLARTLDAEDSAVLRWWVAATHERPIVVLIDERNRSLGAYGPPLRLDQVVSLETESQETGASDDRADEPTLAALPEVPAAPPRIELPHVELPHVEPPHVEPPHVEPPHAALQAMSDADPMTVRLVPDQRELAPRAPDAPRPTTTEWRAWAEDLDAARGPKPMATIERLFVTRYTPLLDVVLRGEGDAHARSVLATFSASFAKSYTEAFGALRVTGKRPMMVLDAPAIAMRIARLHGAKASQLILVDGMRFDVGLRVHDRMRATLGPYAACTERLLLWSALPTNTPTQLELLAAGPEGLTSRGPPSEREEPIVRGRNAATMRRMKIGSRDVFKLDVAEARLREVGPELPERLDGIAEEIARSLVTHAQSLPPRTLLFVFGDHGFRLDATPGSTGPATQGGATPEEVLVPAFAWLVGGLH